MFIKEIEAIKKELRVHLPNANVEGEPFYTIMYFEGDNNSGNYYITGNDPHILLFYSKYTAEKLIQFQINSLDFICKPLVVGVTIEHLMKLIKQSKYSNFTLYKVFSVSNKQIKTKKFVYEE